MFPRLRRWLAYRAQLRHLTAAQVRGGYALTPGKLALCRAQARELAGYRPSPPGCP